MLITFYSKVDADIVMLGSHAQPLLALIGKEAGKRGVLTPAEIPLARQQIQAAIATARSTESLNTTQQEINAVDHDIEKTMAVSLSQRAFPLLAMLERAEKMNEAVLWEVSH